MSQDSVSMMMREVKIPKFSVSQSSEYDTHYQVLTQLSHIHRDEDFPSIFILNFATYLKRKCFVET